MKKQTWTLVPTNENQCMNALIPFEGTKRQANARAKHIAYHIQMVLPECMIGCEVHSGHWFPE